MPAAINERIGTGTSNRSDILFTLYSMAKEQHGFGENNGSTFTAAIAAETEEHMKRWFSLILCIVLILSLLPMKQANAFLASNFGTIVSGQEYSGETPTDEVGNHQKVRFELPIEQDSYLRLIMYTQPDTDSNLALDSPDSPYESDTSYGSFPGCDLTIVNDFYNPIPNVYSTSCYGVTADKRNTAPYTEVFGTIVSGNYYVIISGDSYRFKVFIEPVKYQGDHTNQNKTIETAASYPLGNDQTGVMIPNGIMNNNFIEYSSVMENWYKFTGKAGAYSLTFESDGFFQGTCSILDANGYSINGINPIEVKYEFNNTGKIGGTYEEHLEKAAAYTMDFELENEGTYYVRVSRSSFANGSYLFNLSTSESEAKLDTIKLTPANPSVKVGATVSLTATGLYSDDSTENVTDFVSWTSSNTKIATVTDAGVVKGIAAGTAKIHVFLEGKEKTITVTVTADNIKKITSAKATVYLKLGGTTTNKITAYFTDGTKKVITDTATYKSSSSLLTVSKKGLLKASKAGTYTVTVTYKGKKTTYKVVVK